MTTMVKVSARIDKKYRTYLDQEIDNKRWASYNHAVNQLIAADMQRERYKVKARIQREKQELLLDDEAVSQ